MTHPPPSIEEAPRPRDPHQVGSFLEIGADGIVTIFSGKVELGTGIATALIQIVADELALPIAQIRIVMGDTARTPDQGTTAGSKTLQQAGLLLQRAAAAARHELIDRAAVRLDMSADRLTLANGSIRGIDSGVGIPIGDFSTEPLCSTIPAEIDSTHHASDPVLGRSVERIDFLAKLIGGEAYVHDLRLDGMLHGRIIRPYVRTMRGSGRIREVDDSVARSMPGIVAVVRNGDFLGVVAETEWQAICAAEAIDVIWEPEDSLLPQIDQHSRMRSQPVQDTEPGHTGDVPTTMSAATRTFTATYQFPMQAHASIGPSCAVADVHEDHATIYTSSQGVYGLRKALAPMLGLVEEQVRLIYREGAGCYGHNGADDVSADAALLSQAVGKPVRVQWMRRDEFAWEPKGPAMLIDMAAGLDAQNDIVAWDHTDWSATHMTRAGGQPGNLLAAQQIDPPAQPASVRYGGGDRNAKTTYDFPNERVTMHWLTEPPLRPSALRSLGGLHNTTANELFLDEIAYDIGVDSVEMRRRYLSDPRAIEAIDAVVAASGWGDPQPTTQGFRSGHGFAFVQYETEYTYVAIVADVLIDDVTNEIHVKRIFVAHDCGRIVNPDGVRNQIEGNLIQGIGRSLMEEISWDDQAVTTLTWETYLIPTFPDIPEIEIVLIDRPDQPSWGAGEPAICPVTAAIGNAIFDATGIRLRSVPFTADQLASSCRV